MEQRGSGAEPRWGLGRYPRSLYTDSLQLSNASLRRFVASRSSTPKKRKLRICANPMIGHCPGRVGTYPPVPPPSVATLLLISAKLGVNNDITRNSCDICSQMSFSLPENVSLPLGAFIRPSNTKGITLLRQISLPLLTYLRLTYIFDYVDMGPLPVPSVCV